MSLSPRTRLGPYEITGPLGAGGMGEVYRARDTALNRDVAIKLMPEVVALDPVRLARFEREARTLAALNHPHIAQIYGLEDGGARGKALVMELVPGQTLAERITDGPMAIGEALDIARQIAEALEAAHAEGIIHRDLKPANIKVRDDGTVKVLDFGLAKGGDSGAAAPNLQDSPTFTSPAMTERGLILGTAAYMAPEQARGKPVDRRADIWAFGVVLFEMLTGRQMFAGETVSDTLAAVLREEVPWSTLPSATPPAARRLLERALQKDPKKRLRDMGDARLDLEDAIAGRDIAAPAVPAAQTHARSSKLPWLITAAALAAAAGLAVWALTRDQARAGDVLQFTQITDTAGEETDPSLSPDGSIVAFATRLSGSWDIYAQRVGGRNRTLIVGDPQRDERGPAFSPDGSQIAFYERDADGGIFITGATGESTRRVADVGFHPAWSPDGRQIAYTTEEIFDPYSRQSASFLWVVDAAGGAPRRVSGQDAAQPSWAPDGRRLVFWSNVQGQRDLYTVAIDGSDVAPVLQDEHLDFAPVWAPGGDAIVFASDRGGAMNLWEVPVDPSTGRATGAPVAVTSGVQAAAEHASISKDGARFAFKSRVASVNPYAVPIDPVALRGGTPVLLDSANSILIPASVSPDGTHLLLSNQGSRQEDIFITRTDRFAPRRITDDAARDRGPSWTPDGRAILFYSTRGGKWETWSINADGGGLRKTFSVDDSVVYPLMSPAGDRIAVTGAMAYQILVMAVAPAASDPVPLKNTSNQTGGLMASAWSPDGAALAGPLVPPSGRPGGIGLYDLASARLRQLSSDSCFWVAWLGKTSKVVCLSGQEQVVAVDTQTGQRTVVVEKLPVPSLDDMFAIAPDGRTLYYGGARYESDIWIAERLRK